MPLLKSSMCFWEVDGSKQNFAPSKKWVICSSTKKIVLSPSIQTCNRLGIILFKYLALTGIGDMIQTRWHAIFQQIEDTTHWGHANFLVCVFFSICVGFLLRLMKKKKKTDKKTLKNDRTSFLSKSRVRNLSCMHPYYIAIEFALLFGPHVSPLIGTLHWPCTRVSICW